MDLVVQEISQPVEAVIGREVGEMDPEDVVEDGVVRLPDRVHVLDQQRLAATQAPRDVDVPVRSLSSRSGKSARRTWCDAMAAIPAHFKHAGRRL